MSSDADLKTAWQRELDVACDLARRAGAVARRYHGTELTVDLKKGDEPVTVADRETSALVVAGLREAFPDDVVISEELEDDRRRLSASRVWYIDPIDGTRDFIRGGEGYCIMIGLAVDHRPELGVVYQPGDDLLISAAPDVGTRVHTPGEPPRPVQVSAVREVSEARLVASKSSRSQTIDRVKSVLGISDELNIGSVGLKLAIIAVGDRELYVNPGTKTSSWDTCAPEAILRHAGGRITDLRGEPLRYDEESMRNRRGLVASNGPIHGEVIAKLGDLFPAK